MLDRDIQDPYTDIQSLKDGCRDCLGFSLEGLTVTNSGESRGKKNMGSKIDAGFIQADIRIVLDSGPRRSDWKSIKDP